MWYFLTLARARVCVQYYATVDAGPTSNVRWLTKEDVEDRSASSFMSTEGATGFDLELSSLEGMLGSGQCVGGVVSETVGETGSEVSCSLLVLFPSLNSFHYAQNVFHLALFQSAVF